MCGIAGICLTAPNERVDEALLLRMTRALRHRGPDGEGSLVDRNVGLGHRRLSIIDLAGGAQPIYNEDRTIAVVFNGEIYNYKELVAELEQRGHRFQTHSDTEVIVHAYEEFGTAAVERFVGMFAFAVYDQRDGSVWIARDRLGKKPLFYYRADDRLLFASELKALLEDERLPRRLSMGALDDYLAYGFVPGDRCILNGVAKLPPGCWMRWQAGKLRIERYWDVDFTTDQTADEHEWLERVEAALRSAVRMRLRADVPLGVFLSGGVDSSAIAALAAQELGGRLNCYSIGFRESDFDESHYARQTAQHCGAEHHELIVADQDIDVLGELAYHLDEPFGDPSALPTYYVCREARQHVTVALSGDGGDEVFAGYSRYLRAQKLARVDWVPAPVRRAVGSAVLAVAPPHVWGRGLIERVARSGAERYFAEMSTFSPGERLALFGPARRQHVTIGARCFEDFFTQPNAHSPLACARGSDRDECCAVIRTASASEWSGRGVSARRDLVSTLQHCDQKNYLPDDILVKVDRMSMQVSLEVRAPLLDHRVVEAVNAAPLGLKVRGGRGKYLLRKLIAPHVPPEVLTRRKMGFGIPIKHWFRGKLADYARDMLLAPSSRIATHLESAAIADVVQRHAAGMRDFSRKIWALLMLEHWCRRYGF